MLIIQHTEILLDTDESCLQLCREVFPATWNISYFKKEELECGLKLMLQLQIFLHQADCKEPYTKYIGFQQKGF